MVAGQNGEANALKLGELSRKWLEKQKDTLKPSSYAAYRKAVEAHILPAMGELPLNGIGRAQVEGFLQLLAEKGLGRKSVEDIYVKLKGILKLGVSLGCLEHIAFCPEIPAQKRAAPKTIEADEREKLTSYWLLRKDPVSLGFLMCLYMGLSSGELCALRWEDISQETGRIRVERKIQRLSKEDAAGSAKTEVCTVPVQQRLIPIPGRLRSLLQNAQEETGYFLPGGEGQPMEMRTLQRRLVKDGKVCGLEGSLNFQLLRATFIRYRAENGTDFYTMSQILGTKRVTSWSGRYEQFAKANYEHWEIP